MADLLSQAQIVVVGGGIVGCSTAYHLAQLGYRDIVLLERKVLTSGSTWHAAGLVGQLRSQAGITQLLGNSISLYNRLEKETGLATGWKMNGGLRLACNAERFTEIQRQATTARSFGLEMEILTPTEALQLWPLMNVNDVVGAAFLPTDGQASPSDITQALAKGARNAGVRIIEQCEVTGVHVKSGRVSGIDTNEGPIECEILVNCAGQWARDFGLMANVCVPLVSIQHQYLVTETISGVTADLPTLRDPDRLTYYKEEVGGLVMGGYEANPQAWADDGIPANFEFDLLDSDWDHFEDLMKLALPRVPALENAGVKQLINGPESFTADGNFILGEAPELDGYFVGAGFNAFGIASAGGAGEALAQWIAGGEPPYDLWAVDIRRFGAPHRDKSWVRARTMEMYGKHYTMAWPHEEHQSARPLRRSPLYELLSDRGAVFGEKLGWERPNWFAPEGVERKDHYSYGRQNWFDHAGREHQAVRNSVGLFDQSSFAKFKLIGKDAAEALEYIASNRVARDVGSIVYTQMLNSRGGIECDLTVARIAPDEFYIVTGTGFATHDFDWIRRNLPKDKNVNLVNVTSAWSTLSVMGPNSRALLQRVCDTDLSNEAFPFGRCQTVQIAGTSILALRITYVGELGYELHVPSECVISVFEYLDAIGSEYGLTLTGYRALESLRLEKGYRAWGSDLSPDHTPFEAGLGWAVKLASDIAFIGREALADAKRRPPVKRFAGFHVADQNVVLLGRETIYRNGERVGWLSSGGYGYTVEKNIGYGYLRNKEGISDDWIDDAEWELEVATRRVACETFEKPLYDPNMLRVKS